MITFPFITSNTSYKHDTEFSCMQSELEIEPRYPLLGGWKATFIIGYGLPLQDVLFESADGKRYLNFSFGCPIAETLVNKITNKVHTFMKIVFYLVTCILLLLIYIILFQVVLPEGSKNPSVVVPFPVEQSAEVAFLCDIHKSL